jgi:hypothetical protein
MPLVRTSALPTLTTPITVDVPEILGAFAIVPVSLLGTALEAFPAGSPVLIDPSASGAVIEGATLLPLADLRLRWRGPWPAGPSTIRVTILPSIQIE